MSVVSIHPEDLLDKLCRGTLSPGERDLLEAHLTSCDVCRFELAVSVDFQNEARARSSSKLLPPLPLERRRSRRVIWAIAAAMLIASTGAVASVTRVGQSMVAFVRFGGDDLPTASVKGVEQAPPRTRPDLLPPPSDAQESASASASPAPESQPPVQRRAAPVARPAGSVAEPAQRESAEALFAEANKARRRGDLAQAGMLYRDLQQKFPGSQEAGLSQVTLSMLLLDRGDAAGALAGFDKYLARPRRPLEAEALVGRARALRALGSSSAEVVAWREVQRRYPSSVYARQAEDRLSALGQP